MTHIFIILLLNIFAACSNSGGKDKKSGPTSIPAIDTLPGKKNWGVVDYGLAISSFSTLKDEDPEAFIKYIQTDGAGLFKKLTDYHQYDSLYTNKDLEERFKINTILSNNMRALRKVCSYRQKKEGKLILGHELIRSSIASLYLFQKSISLINEKFPDKEALNKVRKEGLEQMKTGVFEMIRGALITIYNDYPVYPQDDIVSFSRFMVSYIKDVRSFLNKDQQDRVNEEIKKVKYSGTYSEAKLVFSQ